MYQLKLTLSGFQKYLILLPSSNGLRYICNFVTATKAKLSLIKSSNFMHEEEEVEVHLVTGSVKGAIKE